MLCGWEGVFLLLVLVVLTRGLQWMVVGEGGLVTGLVKMRGLVVMGVLVVMMGVQVGTGVLVRMGVRVGVVSCVVLVPHL